ncbi:ethylbenzene dehydrogenase-related protein [Motiliproteus sediminis]|uniref:ethylbenzene dehydrogenase-related protein n=1 Tax=Motiliproteus sediminis TaxID=1468178 RepID=UPI001AEF99E8|nr:ethylbenzene dehydrogenase-related protein [Motiliproteus sediminis]
MNKSVFIASLFAIGSASASSPVNTYFSLAVTENSHNHAGDNLLYLDFDAGLDAVSPRVVVSPKIKSNAITLDGNLGEWRDEQFSQITARVMNNYPLSEFYDAVPGEIEVASAHDDHHVYFAVRFTDANHDASTNRNRWIWDGNQWVTKPHVATNPAAPASRAVNADDELRGAESEDRVLFMFPIIDKLGNFRDGRHGCAGLCHAELAESGDPGEKMIAEDVAKMRTAVYGDMADIWHWTSTRSAPSNTLKDAYADQDGRHGDPGRSGDQDNDYRKRIDRKGTPGPAWVSRSDYEAGRYNQPGFTTGRLTEDDLLEVTADMRFAKGVSVPYSVPRQPMGSYADVEVASHFNPDSFQWTLEFKRRLDTGNFEDHNFLEGEPAQRPTLPVIERGDSVLGAKLFKERKCVACHGEQGEGVFENGAWVYPRIQRASGALIYKTADPNRPKRRDALSFKLAPDAERPRALMPYIKLTAQEAEHIASWLQTQFTPAGQ